jgi:hypothetical protein
MRGGAVVGALLLCAGGAFLIRSLEASPPPSPTVVTLGDVLDFPGATGWRPGSCSDPSCAGAWRHDDGVEVQVLVVPVPDPGRLAALAARLQDDVVAHGGRVDTIAQGGGVIRMLRPATLEGVEHVVISYVLTAPAQRSLHIVTATTTLARQVAVDERVRDLLAFAAWVEPPPP